MNIEIIIFIVVVIGLLLVIRAANLKAKSANDQLRAMKEKAKEYDAFNEQEESLQERLEDLKNVYDSLYEKEKDSLSDKLKQVQESYQVEMSQIEQNYKAQKDEYETKVSGLEGKLHCLKTRSDEIIEYYEEQEKQKNEELYHTILLEEEVKNDIDFLLNNVISRLSNKNIIYKLIWNEYIQKPTNEMLIRVGAKDECGIYKITNIENNKSYIGKSTNVKKRLTDHIKGSLSVGSIAHQKLHDEMAKIGLDKWKFEIISKCSKDELGEKEKFYIDFFKSDKWGYNLSKGGEG